MYRYVTLLILMSSVVMSFMLTDAKKRASLQSVLERSKIKNSASEEEAASTEWKRNLLRRLVVALDNELRLSAAVRSQRYLHDSLSPSAKW